MKNKKEFLDFELEGIDLKDYPDFCDAYIINANVKQNGQIREATDEEIVKLNEDSQFVYELVLDNLW